MKGLVKTEPRDPSIRQSSSPSCSSVAEFLCRHKIGVVINITANQPLEWTRDSSAQGTFNCEIEKIVTMIILNNRGNSVASLKATHFSLTNNSWAHRGIELYVQNWATGEAISADSVIAIVRVLRGKLQQCGDKSKKIPFAVRWNGDMEQTGVLLAAKKIMVELDASRVPLIPNILDDLRLTRLESLEVTEEMFALCQSIEKVYREQLQHERKH